MMRWRDSSLNARRMDVLRRRSEGDSDSVEPNDSSTPSQQAASWSGFDTLPYEPSISSDGAGVKKFAAGSSS